MTSPLKSNIMITGGAGFIGSHVVRLFVNKYPDCRIINVDKLTYAGNLDNLRDIEDRPNYVFIKADICDFDEMSRIISDYAVNGIIHLAAESHVDRSIKDPFTFARTNVLGTLSLLEAARRSWEVHKEAPESSNAPRRIFYHISTDEVYGSLPLSPSQAGSYQRGCPVGTSSTPSQAGADQRGCPVGTSSTPSQAGSEQRECPVGTSSTPSHSGEGRGGATYKLANPDIYPLLKEKAREMRKNMTDGEKAMWNLLKDKNLGTRFRRQHIIGDYIVDFVDLNNGLVIEVDGKYHDHSDQQIYDENRTEFLERQGFNVIRFRNEEIIADPGAVKSQIKAVLESSSPSHSGEGRGGALYFTSSSPSQAGSEQRECPVGTSSTPSHSGEGRGGALYFTESTPYSPHSPYSASKASSDHFVRAYHDTYGLPTIITNCSNNYGPYQFPEKLIPLFIRNLRLGLPLPVYGKGENVRDWLYVEDHARAIDLIFHEGKPGDTYNIGGFNEWRNIDLIRLLVRTVDRLLGNPEGHSDHLITYITDRPGHDLRYAIDSSKLHRELGWSPSLQFEEGIEKTVRWYLDHPDWPEK